MQFVLFMSGPFVTVHDLHVAWAVLVPMETDAPLLIEKDAVPPGTVATRPGRRNRNTPPRGGLRKGHVIRNLPKTMHLWGTAFDVREDLTMFISS